MRSEVQVLLDPPSSTRDGALAQLVERLLCKQDVIGSNPIGSTNLPDLIGKRFALSRPIGRGSSEPFYIVQRDNQRCRLYPSADAVVARPTVTLSKSSTLTNVHAFGREREKYMLLIGSDPAETQKAAV